MIKYKIAHANAVVEFQTELEAQSYKDQHGLPGIIGAFEEAPPVVLLISDVTPRQFRQALVLSGISADNIVEMIKTQPEPIRSLALIEWEYSTAFIRSNPLVNQLAPALGFTSQQLDDLWLLAGTL